MRLVTLTQGYQAMVDDEDFERVSSFKWHVQVTQGKPYAHRSGPIKNGKQPTIMLHRYIMNVPDGIEIDHDDRNGLNCQKYNLRTCTHSQNSQNKGLMSNNTSGIKGVWWDTGNKRWRAKIMVSGKSIDLGSYKDKQPASDAYRNAAIKYHGEFADYGEKK